MQSPRDVSCLCSHVVMPGQGTLQTAVAPEMSRSLSPTPAPGPSSTGVEALWAAVVDRVLLPPLTNMKGHGSQELQTAPAPQNSLSFMPVIIRGLLFSALGAALAVEFSDNKIDLDLLCRRQNHRAQALRDLQMKPRQLKLFRSLTAVYLTLRRVIGDWFYKWMLSI